MTQTPEPRNEFSPFWPLAILAVTWMVFLAWQASIGIRQYLNGVRYAEQQEVMAAQAAQIESNFQNLMMGVLEIAEGNPDVQAVVSNYNIRFTPPAVAAPTTE